MRLNEQAIPRRVFERLSSMKALRIIGSQPDNRISLFSFVIDGVKTEEIVKRLDQVGIAIREGNLAALPLLKRFGAETAARASLYVYTSIEEVDRFGDALEALIK
jgi:cysteine desulfurase / selenocysteine lyase